MDTYFTQPTGRVGVIGVFCICFQIELITGTYGTSHGNCEGVQIEKVLPWPQSDRYVVMHCVRDRLSSLEPRPLDGSQHQISDGAESEGQLKTDIAPIFITAQPPYGPHVP